MKRSSRMPLVCALRPGYGRRDDYFYDFRPVAVEIGVPEEDPVREIEPVENPVPQRETSPVTEPDRELIPA